LTKGKKAFTYPSSGCLLYRESVYQLINVGLL